MTRYFLVRTLQRELPGQVRRRLVGRPTALKQPLDLFLTIALAVAASPELQKRRATFGQLQEELEEKRSMGLLDTTTASEWHAEEAAAYDHHCPHQPLLRKLGSKPHLPRPQSARAPTRKQPRPPKKTIEMPVRAGYYSLLEPIFNGRGGVDKPQAPSQRPLTSRAAYQCIPSGSSSRETAADPHGSSPRGVLLVGFQI